jgi:5'(3')-deoxyribonucleotidase
MEFCLDMDGPCTRFIHGALKALDLEQLIDNYPSGSKNLQEITGIPYPVMYSKIDSLGSDFWRNLEETPSFWELYNGLCELGEVVFCTSPSLDSNSLKGKVEWLQDRFGKHFRNYVITNRKYFCARPNTVLIDDTAIMCEEFVQGGGLVIQYPTRLNGLSHVCEEEHRAKYILEKARELKHGYK